MKNVTYISAGAGSGKTYTLTNKLAELISKDKSDPEHVEPEQVILTTFTIKAANEFKEKAKAELYPIGPCHDGNHRQRGVATDTKILVHHRHASKTRGDGR